LKGDSVVGVQNPFDLDRFIVDLQEYAKIGGVDFDETAVLSTIEPLREHFADARVAVRTTTQPAKARDVNWRMAYRDTANPIPRLKDVGMLTFDAPHMEELLDEVAGRYPGWWAVDAATSRPGIEKFWVLFDGGVPLDEVLALPHLPPSAHAARAQFERTEVTSVGIIGLDLRRHTVNLYSDVFPADTLTPGSVIRMIEGLGWAVPDQDSVRRNAAAFNFYQTVGWDSPDVLRLCFPVRYEATAYPVHLHPVLKRFVEQAPFPTRTGRFMFYNTYGPRGGYYKVQADYTGDHEAASKSASRR
jgi:hypothetical protein